MLTFKKENKLGGIPAWIQPHPEKSKNVSYSSEAPQA